MTGVTPAIYLWDLSNVVSMTRPRLVSVESYVTSHNYLYEAGPRVDSLRFMRAWYFDHFQVLVLLIWGYAN